ncbi:nucleotidyltransferase domain-containing protein [Natronococcus sp. A-GB7]|uniref:nucleotidyltransferase domain-containing protein n=1 Tax=Natronococcus sp. A-GB7 TaxID=3037649 RepID=UPI00241C7607|nr:nucleotidyltransferase domain-containing protein [Natronococcus sp. A-GB7]MDG5820785.1 nucleotidyltransferase domain-containing protein [Natronococcus sp. A-GB7]
MRHRDESFSMTNISEAVDYTRPTITKTVDVLSNNDLVVEERDGSRRMVQINRDRLTLPDDPYLEIPQSEFHAPVKAAMEALLNELDGVLAVVLYGSVARGEADRRSDIDLWVLVREDRMGNQRRANRVRQSLEEDAFDGERYAFEIDVEGLQAIPNYADELREILRDGIAIHRTNEFDTVRKMVLHGDADE